jgi:hypothetical protein|tara:strand:+ start:211 stop:486 length:276 start_codon:yes stop_codon:yes gene_type:complete
MGKLSRKQAERMLSQKTISQEAFDKMEQTGQIAKKRGNTERVIRSANNTWAIPTFYYKGLNGKKRSKKMIELREKVNQLITEYTVPKSKTI